jgi:hypothetical protein
MIDEHEDLVFDHLLSRMASRESASIAVVSLTASASLIFLAFFTNEAFYWESFSIGIIFPTLAFIHNEITNRELHRDDQDTINEGSV